MYIVLHCRVLSLLLASYLYISFLNCTLMQCLSGSLQRLCGELTINYQPILTKADLLSCLSTAVGLVHEPPLPNGVVNPWQPNSGTQCGAYGQWTGPYAHRCNTQLLGEIASHPQLSRQHHQLAHVSQPVANSRSHTKNDFFQQKNTSQCMTFPVRPTGWHQAVHTTITHTNSAGGLCPVTNGGHCNLCKHDPLHSQGEHGDHKEPHNQEGSSKIILRLTGNLAREMIPGPSWHDADNCTVNLVIVPGALNSNSARGTEHCKCQGHLTLNSARGTEHLWYHGHIWQ